MQKGQCRLKKRQAHTASDYLHLCTILTGCVYSGERLRDSGTYIYIDVVWNGHCKEPKPTMSSQTNCLALCHLALDNVELCSEHVAKTKEKGRNLPTKFLQNMFISVLDLRERKRKTLCHDPVEENSKSPAATQPGTSQHCKCATQLLSKDKSCFQLIHGYGI
jgi:hypothetical protein